MEKDAKNSKRFDKGINGRVEATKPLGSLEEMPDSLMVVMLEYKEKGLVRLPNRDGDGVGDIGDGDVENGDEDVENGDMGDGGVGISGNDDDKNNNNNNNKDGKKKEGTNTEEDNQTNFVKL